MKEKIKKIFNLRNISLFINLIYIIILSLLFVKLFKIDVIPSKYLYEVMIIFFLILSINLLLIFKNKKMKKTTLAFDVISILIILFSLFVYFKILKTDDFVNKITNNKVEVTTYYVIANNKSKYKNIHDIRNKNVYYLETEFNVDNVLKKLQDKVSVNLEKSDDALELAQSLLEDIENLILISDANYDLIIENNENFEKNTTILYTITIKSALEDISKDVKVTEEAFNVYISGIDTFGVISTKARSDVNIIMTINPKTKQILLTSIPRDYYVQLHGTTGYKDKLTHAGVYGINKSVQTLEDLFNLDINYYVRVNFNTLIDVVDEIGGIEIYSDKAFIPWVNGKCPIKKGVQTLNGTCSLAYARERHAYATGDRHRGQNQQQVIEAIINKVSTSKKTITNYNEILNALEGSFQTNMSSDEIYSLIKMQINYMKNWNIESQSVNGYDSSNYTYSYGSQKLYVMEPDMYTVETAKTKIYELLD